MQYCMQSYLREGIFLLTQVSVNIILLVGVAILSHATENNRSVRYKILLISYSVTTGILALCVMFVYYPKFLESPVSILITLAASIFFKAIFKFVNTASSQVEKRVTVRATNEIIDVVLERANSVALGGHANKTISDVSGGGQNVQ